MTCGPLATAEEDLRAQAIDITRAGAEDYAAGRFSSALVRFEDAYRLVPAPALMLNLSRTHLKLDHCGDALRFAQMRQAVAADSEAKSWLGEVQSRCVKLEIVTDPAGASITIEGASDLQRTTPWSGYLKTGSHLVTLRSAGFADRQVTIDLVAGNPRRLEIKLDPGASVARPPDRHEVPKAVAAPAKSSFVRTAGWVAVATGAAALIAAVVVGATVRADSAALGRTSPTRTGQQSQSDITSINERATGANVLFGVGGGLSAAGGVVVIVW